MIEVKIIKKSKKNGGGGRASSGGGFYSPSGSGTSSSAEEAAHAERADLADLALEANHAAEADYSKEAGVARDLTGDSPVYDRFIRKDRDDRTEHSLGIGKDLTVGEDLTVGKDATVGKDLTVKGRSVMEELMEVCRGMQSPGYVSGMNGHGWGIDKNGNAGFESAYFRSFAEFAEIISNRQTAIEGDVVLSESDIIESVDDLGGGHYTLHLHRKWEGYFTAQYVNNVVKGIFNNITPGMTPGVGQQSVSGAVYYTSWMLVQSVNPTTNSIDVLLYPDEETPAGRNFPPVEMMRISRWGNAGDERNPDYARRQSCLYLSSTEGRIRKLYHVTKPIIDKTNEAFSLGTLPEFLEGINNIKVGDDGLYAAKIVTGGLIIHDHFGRPIPDYVYRGPFDEKAAYFNGGVNPESGRYERSISLHYGCQWVCNKEGTHNPPSWDSTDWIFYLGDPTFRVELTGGLPVVRPRKFRFTLRVKGTKGNQDVTHLILPQDVVWTRYSEDSAGNERTASDTIWALRRGGETPPPGLSLTVDERDLDSGTGVPPVCRFIATVGLRDGTELTSEYGI